MKSKRRKRCGADRQKSRNIAKTILTLVIKDPDFILAECQQLRGLINDTIDQSLVFEMLVFQKKVTVWGGIELKIISPPRTQLPYI